MDNKTRILFHTADTDQAYLNKQEYNIIILKNVNKI